MKLNEQKNTFFFEKFSLVHDFLKLSFFIKHMFTDPTNIKRNKYHELIKKTQLDPSKPLFVDRQKEIEEFFGLKPAELFFYYLKNGFPFSYRFKKRLTPLLKKIQKQIRC